jgi:hypothetical protein
MLLPVLILWLPLESRTGRVVNCQPVAGFPTGFL